MGLTLLASPVLRVKGVFAEIKRACAASFSGTRRRKGGLIVGMMTRPQFFSMDKEAITEWLVNYKHSDRRLIPQLHCPLCRQLNHERRIQGLQDRQAAAEWSEAWAEH